jgi:hypothetical protein
VPGRITVEKVMSRRVPEIPPRHEKLRVVIDSDAKNEIDDQYATALAPNTHKQSNCWYEIYS